MQPQRVLTEEEKKAKLLAKKKRAKMKIKDSFRTEENAGV